MKTSFAILWLLISAGCAGGQVATTPPAASVPETTFHSDGARPEPPRASAPASPSVVLSPPRQAFVDGYRAYTNHDPATAAERLTIAAETYPQLADYSLMYLGSAQRDLGDLNGAERSFNRLVETYPQSVFAEDASYQLAAIAFKQDRAARARDLTTRILLRAVSAELEQETRLLLARSSAATSDPRAAYVAFQTLRLKYPRGAYDSQAREEAYALLGTYPHLLDSHSFRYHRDEAELLLREGRPADARIQIKRASATATTVAQRAELTWLTGKSWMSDPARRKAALESYLRMAPRGPSAPEALYDLARLYWHDDDTQQARIYFQQIPAKFPENVLAPEAMLKIGRTFEEDNRLSAARAIYERLIIAYPYSEAASEARFRAPWMLYMAGDYAAAARSFDTAKGRSTEPAERDMFGYWQARALEKSGDQAAARPILERVAASIDSNYYPALAARRIGADPAVLPAASVADPIVTDAPAITGTGEFHLSRAIELQTLGLDKLEAGELRTLRSEAGHDPSLRDFLLVEFQKAGDYHDPLILARTIAERGEMNPNVAERFRYPRGYWDLIAPASKRTGLDPYLLLALMRQESLFDPQARSVSDARGLMQLLPSTAERVAVQSGMSSGGLNLWDPTLNVELGTAYLKNLFEMFGDNPFKAVAAYNGGEHAVQRWNARFSGDDDEWVENIDFHETRDYVKKVLGGQREYRLLYGPASRA
ncbi:MAG TPA: transglycosylase SLT domain-containing protein [Candidatus Binataceae bacterium]|nr:transglycosylase SLT domain-containing protein [Candidatus Binataceae bacterium]